MDPHSTMKVRILLGHTVNVGFLSQGRLQKRKKVRKGLQRFSIYNFVAYAYNFHMGHALRERAKNLYSEGLAPVCQVSGQK